MRNTISTKSAAVTLSFALVMSSFPASAMPAAGTRAPDFVKALTPPDALGLVASSYDAGGAAAPKLIVVADLHGHVDVQHKIIGILVFVVLRVGRCGFKKPFNDSRGLFVRAFK